MPLYSNQFNMTVTKGMVDASTPNRLQVGKISASQGTAIGVATPVKINDEASKVIPLIACTAATDKPEGFLVFNTHRETFSAGMTVEYAPCGSHAIVILEASAAIANGAKVEMVISGNKVATSGGSNTVIGTALDKATAAGQLIRVRLDIKA